MCFRLSARRGRRGGGFGGFGQAIRLRRFLGVRRLSGGVVGNRHAVCLANRDGLAAALQRDVASRDLKGRTRGVVTLVVVAVPAAALPGDWGTCFSGCWGVVSVWLSMVATMFLPSGQWLCCHPW